MSDTKKSLGELLNELKVVEQRDKPLSAPIEVISVMYGYQNRPFHIPYLSKGSNFVGRDELIDKIWFTFNQTNNSRLRLVCIQGLAGIGKTQLAVEYAHKYSEKYINGVIWLNADQDIESQLSIIAEETKWTIPNDKFENKVFLAKARIQTFSDCLIIFDNLENYPDIVNYLPKDQVNNVHILATSRQNQPHFEPILLDTLSFQESARLLAQTAGKRPQNDIDRTAFEEIIKSLDGIPLAIELAGSYLRYNPAISWVTFSQLLHTNLEEFLSQGPFTNDFTKQEQNIHLILRLNEELYDKGEYLREILDILSWSGTSAIGLSLLSSLVGVEETSKILKALKLGLEIGVLKKVSEVERYYIHRLLANTRRKQFPDEKRAKWVGSISERAGRWFSERKNDLVEFELEVEHLQAWQANALSYSPIKAVGLSYLQATPYASRGQYPEARVWLEKSLSLYEDTKSQNLDLLSRIHNDLGNVLSDLGTFAAAMEHHQVALKINTQIFGENHTRTAGSLNNIGLLNFYIGNYEEALLYASNSLKIRENVLGKDNPQTAATLNNVGMIYEARGQFEKALECKFQALQINEKNLGESHPDTATSYYNLGSTYISLGQYDKALSNLKKALQIREKSFGRNHPTTAMSLESLGAIYGILGKYQDSLKYLLQSLEIRLETLGEDHPATAHSLDNIGVTYGYLNMHERALEYQTRALKVFLKIYGEKHPKTAHSFRNIGATYNNLKFYSKALEHHLHSLKLYQELFSEDHPETAISLENVGLTYQLFDKYDEALKCQLRALEIKSENFGLQHPEIAKSLINISAIYFNLQDNQNALKYAENALQSLINSVDVLHPYYIKALQAVIMGLVANKQNEKAEAIIYDFLAKLPPEHTSRQWFEKYLHNLGEAQDLSQQFNISEQPKINESPASERIKSQERSQPKVFISHSTKDKYFVRNLVQDLRKEGIDIWLDELEGSIGDSIVEKIQTGLQNSHFLLVVLSPHSVNSRHIKEEYSGSLMDEPDSQKVRVLPVLLSDCEIPNALKEKIYVDFRDPLNYEEEVDKLVDIINT